MAKHTKRRGRGAPLVAVRVNAELAAGALAQNDLVTGSIGATWTDSFLLSAQLYASARGFTAGEGPILVGLSHDDYSAAEVEEWVEATGSGAAADLVATEQAKRKCRDMVTFILAGANEVANDGKPIKVPLKFILNDGSGLNMWIYNAGSTNPLTTGGIVEISGKIFAKRK